MAEILAGNFRGKGGLFPLHCCEIIHYINVKTYLVPPIYFYSNFMRAMNLIFPSGGLHPGQTNCDKFRKYFLYFICINLLTKEKAILFRKLDLSLMLWKSAFLVLLIISISSREGLNYNKTIFQKPKVTFLNFHWIILKTNRITTLLLS